MEDDIILTGVFPLLGSPDGPCARISIGPLSEPLGASSFIGKPSVSLVGSFLCENIVLLGISSSAVMGPEVHTLPGSQKLVEFI